MRKVRKVVKRLVPKRTTTTSAPNGRTTNAAEAASSTRSSPVEVGAAVAGEPTVAEKMTKKKNLARSTGGGKVYEAGSGRKKRMREVFVGGLDVNATEEDVRLALADAGEITEVRMVMDAESPATKTKKKNRGYCFVQYREAEQARKAIADLGGVKVT